MAMKIGFTGTSKGMTRKQKDTLWDTKVHYGEIEFHHGDCIGADEQAHAIFTDKVFNQIVKTVIHPPTDPKKRAFCKGDEILPERPYLDRNKDIVDATEILIATPETSLEVLRSGTWSTVRYAIRRHRLVILIFPDGTTVNK